MRILHPLPVPVDHKDLTLADVRAVIEHHAGLRRKRRRELLSSLDRFGKLLREDLARILLHIPSLRERLAAINPVAKGISHKTLFNIRWGLLSAIKQSGLKPGVLQDGKPQLTEPWKNLAEALPRLRHRAGMSRLACYCSRNGIDPKAVDDSVISALMAEVWDTSLVPNQHQLHRNTTIIWNEIVVLLPDLGLRPVTVPLSRRVYTRVKPEELPATLRKDIDDYLAWCGVDDKFAKNAREGPLAPGTITLISGYLNAAATALAKSGVDLSSITTLADLVSVESVRQIFRFRNEAAGGHDSSYNVGLGIALAQIAQDWVHTDPDSLAELKRMASKFPRETLGRMNDKNRKRLRQFDDDPQVMKRLLEAPARLWREAMIDPKPTIRTLSKAEAAIAIAFLTEMPVRLENLTDLAYDVHLFMASAPGGTSTLEVPGDEVKNGVPIGFDIPPHVAKMLIEFRDVLAPKLIGCKPSHVFVNADGTLKIAASVRALIQRAVKRHVGIEFNPHTFRHLAGKVILDRDPGAYEVVRQFLGHKRIQTTINFYTGIDTRRAGLHHHRLLEEALAERSKPVRGKRRTTRHSDSGG